MLIVEGGDLTYDFGTMPQSAEGKHTLDGQERRRGSARAEDGELDLFLHDRQVQEWREGDHQAGRYRADRCSSSRPGKITATTPKGPRSPPMTPTKPLFDLQVKGMVFPPVMTAPPEPFLNYSTISNDEDEHLNYIAVYSRDRPETKITKISTSNKEIVAETSPVYRGRLQAASDQVRHEAHGQGQVGHAAGVLQGGSRAQYRPSQAA